MSGRGNVPPGHGDLEIGWDYLRVSVARKGKRQRSTSRQHDDNVEAALEFGIRVERSYEDIDRSASRAARKAREDFDQLVDDLRNDRFRAKYLVLWESSRGSRKVSEWVLLIELLEQRGALVFVTTHRRIYDPSNPRDRRSLIDDANDAEYESAKTSERVTSDVRKAATKGRPHGRAPVGYKRIYDPETGDLIGQIIDEEKAPMIRALFKQLHEGHKLADIARDFDEAGYRNGLGKPYQATHLRVIALRHSYAGIRVHDAGRFSGGINPSPEARLIDAEWPEIVDQVTFDEVREILRDPKRFSGARGRGIHFITMTAKCGVCGAPLACLTARGPAKLVCKAAGHVKILMDPVDEYAEKMLKKFLANPKQVRRLDGDDETERLKEVRRKLSKARTDRKELTRRVKAGLRGEPGGLSQEMAAEIEPDLIASERALVAEERELMMPGSVSRLLAPGRTIDERWENTVMSARRKLARLIFAPDVLGTLVVYRSPRPGARDVPVEERVGFLRPESVGG